MTEAINDVDTDDGSDSSTEGADKCREVGNNIKKETKKSKQEWTEDQCRDIESSFGQKNNTKSYQLVKDLTNTQ